MESAKELAADFNKLKSRLRDKSFQEACFYCGLEPKDLYPRAKEEFSRLPDRAQVLSDETILLRWQDFERTRLRNLAEIIYKQKETDDYIKCLKKDEDRREQTLRALFQKKLDREKDRRIKTDDNRNKYVKALKMENKRILKTRGKAAEQAMLRTKRNKNVVTMRGSAKDNYRYLQKCRQAKIMKQVQAVRRKQEERADEIRAEVKAKIDKMNAIYDAADQNAQQRGMLIREENLRLAKERQEREDARRQKMLKEQAERDKRVKEVQQNRDKRIADEKIKRRLKIERRAQRAQQVRKANEYARQRLVKKMESTDRRIFQMKQMKAALEIERKKNQRLEWIAQDKWKQNRVLERAVTPGPGDYVLPSTLHVSGGTWGRYKPLSEIERIMEQAKHTPGPGSYPQKSTLNLTGGSWSFYSPKSDIEWAEERARAQPGPGEYDPRRKEIGHGMKFSEANAKSDLQKLIDEKAFLPGPGLYSDPMPKPTPKLATLIKKFSPTLSAIKYAGKLKRGVLAKVRKASNKATGDHDPSVTDSAEGDLEDEADLVGPTE